MHTLVLGATTNPSRIAYVAIERLVNSGYAVSTLGLREGTVAGVPIQTGTPKLENVDTITLYLNPERQIPLYDYILSLQPKRIIFNPGTENPALIQLAHAANIETELACTLVMLSTGTYERVA